MILTLSAALITLVAAPAIHAQMQHSTAEFAWVQMVEGGAQVRAIVAKGARCPRLRINGESTPMDLRAEPQPALTGFPSTCQATLPKHTRKIVVDGVSLPVPTTHVKRIVIIGDTGCRVNAGEHQNCEKDWPFGLIANAAADRKPDLVIHVGDYYYREVCDKGVAHCETFTNWKLDFFDPAGPLFLAAPWILARGNHETCNRASQGWFRYLDVADAPLPCPKAKEQTFTTNIDGLSLITIDTADMPDAWPADKKLESFVADIATTHPAPKTQQWIITHKPPFVQGYMKQLPSGADEKDPPMPTVDSIIAGHLHLFGSFDFEGKRPSQLIVGDSGTRLMVIAKAADDAITKTDPNAMVESKGPIDGKDAEFTVKARFGYFLLERKNEKAKDWTGTLFNTEDKPTATCKMQARALHCESVKAVAALPSPTPH